MCYVHIYESKNIYPFLSIDHLPNSQDATPVVNNLNSLRNPLETRQALSFVGVSWFLVSYHKKFSMLFLFINYLSYKVLQGRLPPPPGPPKKNCREWHSRVSSPC